MRHLGLQDGFIFQESSIWVRYTSQYNCTSEHNCTLAASASVCLLQGLVCLRVLTRERERERERERDSCVCVSRRECSAK
jgi:hypothetical protein